MKLVVPLSTTQDTKGGVGNSVYLTLVNMPDDIEPIVVTAGDTALASHYQAHGIRIESVGSFAEADIRLRNPLRATKTFLAYRRVISSLLGPQSVIMTNQPVDEVICGLGDPFPWTSRCHVVRSYGLHGKTGRMCRMAMKNARSIVTLTELGFDAMGFEPRDGQICRTIPNPVDIGPRDDGDWVRPDWYREDELYIGVVGYPSVIKNQEMLVRAIAILKERFPAAKCVIVGSLEPAESQAYAEHLRKTAAELDVSDRVIIQDYLSDKKSIYSPMHIVVSVSLREGFGRTIIEAFAAGKPVVSTRSGGPNEIIVDGENGFLLNTYDPAELAECVGRLLGDKDLCDKIRANALASARRYEASAIASEYADLFREMVGIQA